MQVVNGAIVFGEERLGKCELCGKHADLRPYGPDGENICYDCGMKNKETTNKAMDAMFIACLEEISNAKQSNMD